MVKKQNKGKDKKIKELKNNMQIKNVQIKELN